MNSVIQASISVPFKAHVYILDNGHLIRLYRICFLRRYLYFQRYFPRHQPGATTNALCSPEVRKYRFRPLKLLKRQSNSEKSCHVTSTSSCQKSADRAELSESLTSLTDLPVLSDGQ